LKGAAESAATGRQTEKTMINRMTINGVKAVITYDSDIDLFRGEFTGLNGGADFCGANACRGFKT